MKAAHREADLSTGTFVSSDHGADQILAMPEARQNHSGDMGENEPERDVGDEHVRLLYRFAGVFSEHPGERPRLMFPAINHKAGYHRRCKEEKKENHHGAAARAMPEMALGTKQDEIAYIAERRGWTVDEVREACPGWPDEAHTTRATISALTK